MARPRTSNHHLPKGVYKRGGTYFRIVDGKYRRLGRVLDEGVLSMERPLLESRGSSKARILAECLKALSRCRRSSNGRRKLAFSLTEDDVRQLLERGRYRCAVTGMRFSLEKINGRRPFMPSIDRIDSNLGYVSGNCRIVCVITNFAMNVWGHEALYRLIRTAKAVMWRIEDQIQLGSSR